ncbi:hypothetical protein GCM10010313_34670 [Streptomyces violarus]|uniref:Uncharacterized protein n=1 Tax=Streptomyces violarus TaxID=67380 RepID=A0A7W5F148_9ACTN|nr:hypothetical protein [Streptomyces violarus]GHD11486.1 hypothetical protein GCM10010313_34670 [Streptomyces violarus]
MSPRAGNAGPHTLAFVESPVQLLNVLEWAHAHAPGVGLTLVVLSPVDPMTRGQLRRMSDLARDEGHAVRWEEARGGPLAPFQTIGGLTGLLRRARRVVLGDPFSRYVQLLLTITRARDLVVVDDGTATMEFVGQLARGERLVRWHRKGGRPGPRDLIFAPVSSSARRRLTPGGRRRVEIFSSMPMEETPEGVTISANDFAWTRARFGPPRITKGADMVGTSLVETGVVDDDRYLEAVRALAAAHGATRYFAHRRESPTKLRRLAVETGLEIVRPELPLELIARRGPIGRTILSFPSTVVHTLPLALSGTEVRVAVCDIDPAWLTENASPRAQGFLSGVTGAARDVHRLSTGGSGEPGASESPTGPASPGSITGPAGSASMTGPAGSGSGTGAAGSASMTGPAGSGSGTGAAGSAGMTGPAGPAGPGSIPGPTGRASVSGPAGTVGSAGRAGPADAAGAVAAG